MAAGGTFMTQNKIRPGAYINFVGVPKSLSSVGERGVVAIPYAASWGDSVIEVLNTDLLQGKSLEKIGLSFADDDALWLRLVLQSCSKAIIARTNSSPVKAGKTIGGIACEAVYGGTFGNKIEVSVVIASHEEDDGNGGTTTVVDSYTVTTWANGTKVDSQKMANISSLVNNAYVKFTPSGSITAATRTKLENGTDGSVTASSFSDALAALDNYSFNILAITQSDAGYKAQAVLYVQNLREEQGRYCQVVINDYSSADSEAVINVVQGYKTSTDTITAAQTVLTVAGLEAGATITQSLSGTVIPDAISVVGAPTTHEDIEAALNAGKFVLSRRADGAIVCEKDQNTLHTFTPSKGYIFSKNRPLRVLDQIGNDVKALFNNSYLGKVSNDENGRNIFKADLCNYFNQLQNIGAIQNFVSDDIVVLPGEAVDAVSVQMYVQPVDSMEKLYMVVNVEG